MIALRAVRRHERDVLGADHQGGVAARRRHFMALMVMAQFGFSLEALFARAVAVKTQICARNGGLARPMQRRQGPLRSWAPGGFIKDPVSAHLVRHGADVRHRRPAAYPDALLHRARCAGRRARSMLWATVWIGYFYVADLHHRLRRDRAGRRQSGLSRRRRWRCSAAATWRRSIWRTRSAAICSSASSRQSPSPRSSRWSPG